MIGYGIAGVALILFGVAAFDRGGASGLINYAITAALACLIAFLAIAFLPAKTRWLQVVLWVVPVSILAAFSGWYAGGWLFGYLLGMAFGNEVSGRRKRMPQ